MALQELLPDGGGTTRTRDVGTAQPVRRALLVGVAASSDALAVVAGSVAAYVVRFILLGGAPVAPADDAVVVALAAGWLVVLALCGAYEPKAFDSGTEDYKRVSVASVRVFAAVAVGSYALHLEFSRGYVAIALTTGATLMLAGRWLFRRWLRAQRSRGRQVHRVVVVGDARPVAALVSRLREAGGAYCVVAACVEPDEGAHGSRVGDVPVLGGVADAAVAAAHARADTVAVAASSSVTPERLRALAWSLEGTGVDLMVAPALVDVAGPRIAVHPVAGLPLLAVAEPQFSGPTRAVKRLVDVVLAGGLLLALAPLLLALAVAVRLDSPGPALFRQVRIGIDGRDFRVWKFRTMHRDADARLSGLMAEHAGGDAVFFKLPEDPRVTRLGRALRRYSLDELPQVLNVLRGDMSLVGPRPQRPHEVALYDDAMRRRLLVKPGVTGLWQVSGRSDLSPEEGIRLDLYYVENWSVVLDVVILARTAAAVLRGKGAY